MTGCCWTAVAFADQLHGCGIRGRDDYAELSSADSSGQALPTPESSSAGSGSVTETSRSFPFNRATLRS